MILKRLEVGMLATNCYIVGSDMTKEGMVIDPAADDKLILKTVKDSGLDIKLIVLTHSHPDHIGSIGSIKEATGAGLAVHPDDAEGLRSAETRSFSAMFGLAYKEPPEPERLLKEGDNIDLGDLHFKVLHTPGHSPGGICLVGHGVAFTGDTLFNCGIGRTDLAGGSYNQLLNSIHTRLMVMPDETVIYPGHGPHSTIGAERTGNPFIRGVF